MRRAAAALVGVSAILLTIACGGGAPRTHYYLLEPSDLVGSGPETPDSTRAAGRRIGVRTFVVDPPYDQDRIVYRVGDESTEVGFYAYHRWAVSLARMLPIVTAALLQNAAADTVYEPARASGGYDAYLDGRLFRLEEVDRSDGARVRARLELVLRAPDGEILWSHTAAAESIVQTTEVSVVVDEMRSVLERALREAAAAGAGP